jgi:hypothetical protein
MVMQSTGQGARQSSQPVHRSATMVCICFDAPTMASTGQAWMHRVQPMQVFSSMTATAFGFGSSPSPSGLASTPSSSARLLDIGVAAGRAAVDVGFTLGDGLGIGPAARIAALAALGLRQDGVDLVDHRVFLDPMK